MEIQITTSALSKPKISVEVPPQYLETVKKVKALLSKSKGFTVKAIAIDRMRVYLDFDYGDMYTGSVISPSSNESKKEWYVEIGGDVIYAEADRKSGRVYTESWGDEVAFPVSNNPDKDAQAIVKKILAYVERWKKGILKSVKQVELIAKRWKQEAS